MFCCRIAHSELYIFLFKLGKTKLLIRILSEYVFNFRRVKFCELTYSFVSNVWIKTRGLDVSNERVLVEDCCKLQCVGSVPNRTFFDKNFSLLPVASVSPFRNTVVYTGLVHGVYFSKTYYNRITMLRNLANSMVFSFYAHL